MYGHSHDRISWSIFTKIGTDVWTPKSKYEFIGVNIAPPLPPCCLPTPILDQEVLKIHENINNLISALHIRESPKFSRLLRKSGSMNMMVTADLRPKVELWPFRACAMKNVHYSRYYGNSSVIKDFALLLLLVSRRRVDALWQPQDGCPGRSVFGKPERLDKAHASISAVFLYPV